MLPGQSRVLIMKIRAPRTVWTQDEIDFVVGNYHLKTVRVIAEELNRSIQGVMCKAKYLGISDLTMQKLLRQGLRAEALALSKPGAKYCPFLTTRFGHETPGHFNRFGSLK